MWKPIFLLILTLCSIARRRRRRLWCRTPPINKKRVISRVRSRSTRVLEDLSHEVVVRSNLGAALAGLGRFEEAVAEYKIALKQSPALPGAALNLALAYYKMGRIGDAASRLVKVHRESPQNTQATLLLADCYLRMAKMRTPLPFCSRRKDCVRTISRSSTCSERP